MQIHGKEKIAFYEYVKSFKIEFKAIELLAGFKIANYIQ